MPLPATLQLLAGLDSLAEDAQKAASAIDNNPLSQKLETAIDTLDASWSQSTLGYHGMVFLEGFRPRQPGEYFNPEWGLMESLFEGSRGSWREYSEKEVINELLKRAKIARDPSAEILSLKRDALQAFNSLKEETLTTLQAIEATTTDGAIKKLQSSIEAIDAIDTSIIEDQTRPNSANYTRDTRAIAAGTRIIPPHRSMRFNLQSARSQSAQLKKLISTVKSVASYFRKLESLKMTVVSPLSKDARAVFVIHGRNQTAADELAKFISAIGLRVLTFAEARRGAGTQPSVYDCVKFGVSSAQVVIALFTPDEWACLDPKYVKKTDKDLEKQRWQARPNVPFEAGLAMGLNPAGTILATWGSSELPSDISGLHQTRLSNDPAQRHEFLLLLKELGCPVSEKDSAHLTTSRSGDFSNIESSTASNPF